MIGANCLSVLGQKVRHSIFGVAQFSARQF